MPRGNDTAHSGRVRPEFEGGGLPEEPPFPCDPKIWELIRSSVSVEAVGPKDSLAGWMTAKLLEAYQSADPEERPSANKVMLAIEKMGMWPTSRGRLQVAKGAEPEKPKGLEIPGPGEQWTHT